MRVGLKLAILQSGKSQRQIAAEIHSTENRLSELVRGWVQPRDTERDALARVLNRTAEELFAQTPEDEVHIRRALDGLHTVIVHTEALGCEERIREELSSIRAYLVRTYASVPASGSGEDLR